MILRTDLALENREAEGSRGLHQRDQDGCRVTTLVVEKQEESRYQKPQGTYITVEMEPFSDHLDRENRYRKIVTEELKKLLPMRGTVSDTPYCRRVAAINGKRLFSSGGNGNAKCVGQHRNGSGGTIEQSNQASKTVGSDCGGCLGISLLTSVGMYGAAFRWRHCARFRCGEYSSCHQSRNPWRSGHCHRCSYGCRRCHVGIGIIRGKRDSVFSADCSSGIPQRSADGGDPTRD